MKQTAALWAAAIARRCSRKATGKPAWVELCDTRIFPVLKRIKPCLPLYTETLKAMRQEDFKPRGLIVAEEDVEPWISEVRGGAGEAACACKQQLPRLPGLLLQTAEPPSFWRLNFEAAAPHKFARFLEEVARHRKCSRGRRLSDDAIPESLSALADEVYGDWLTATAQPLKGEVRAALASCGLLLTKEELQRPRKPAGKS
ncbi:hypothetical protein Efla_006158 [Eimeria flavescens]